MLRYEYKTVGITLKGWGFFRSKRMEGFEQILSREGAQGWRYVDSVPQTRAYGSVASIMLVFERERTDR